MAKKLKTKAISPALAAKEWIDLRNAKLKIESRCEELKDVLKAFLEKEPERVAIFSGWKFFLCDMEREFFDLSAAKAKLKAAVLKPFIKLSCSTHMRTAWAGGEEKEAA